jgi:sugar lactone lactonase YvrE
VTAAITATDDHRCLLAENPRWLQDEQLLQHVDITRREVHRLDPRTGERHATAVDGDVGFAVPRERGGSVQGIEHAIVLVAADGARTVLAEVEADRAENRLNDGQCDPAGRLWAGTLSRVRTPRTAALYRVDTDGAVTAQRTGLTLANGTGWSPDGATMYFIDSTEQRVDAFEYDVRDGTLGVRRALAVVGPADGLPDGLAVDAEGGVWVALFGGGAIRRYAPDGSLTAVLGLPTSNVTSMAFGGPGLDRLYITTARHRLTEAQLRDQPLAGAILQVDVGVAGLPGRCFGG